MIQQSSCEKAVGAACAAPGMMVLNEGIEMCSVGSIAVRQPVVLATAHCVRCERLIDSFRPMGFVLGDRDGRPVYWCRSCLDALLQALVDADKIQPVQRSEHADFVKCSSCGCSNFRGEVKNSLGETNRGRIVTCDGCTARLLQ